MPVLIGAAPTWSGTPRCGVALGLLGGLEIASVLRDASALSLALDKNRALIRHQRVARRKGELAQP